MESNAPQNKFASGFHTKQHARLRKTYKQVSKFQSAFKIEEAGYLELDGKKLPTQDDILRNAPIAAKSSYYELNLNYGPYRTAFDSSGRFLGFCGGGGHVAAFEWRPKRLLCESNVKESCNDICWIGGSPQLAVAQKHWSYIYDREGLELHCLKHLHKACRLLWSPHYWLLIGATETSYIHWLDVTTGKMIGSHCMHLGPLKVVDIHHNSGCLLTGHSNGTVNMWTPLEKRSVVKMLVGSTAVQSLAVQSNYMYTWLSDSKLKVWDIRKYDTVLNTVKFLPSSPHLAVSQRGLIAAPCKQAVCVFSNLHEMTISDNQHIKPMLLHHLSSPISSLQFCPWEDVLSFGHRKGVGSVVVPGSGDPNPDGLSGSHPMTSRKQRQEAEVRNLLDKLSPEMIQPPSSTCALNQVDEEGIEETLERKRAAILALPSDQVRKFEPRRRAKRSGKIGNTLKRKSGTKWDRRRLELKSLLTDKDKVIDEMKGGHRVESSGVKKTTKLSATTGTLLDKLLPKE